MVRTTLNGIEGVKLGLYGEDGLSMVGSRFNEARIGAVVLVEELEKGRRNGRHSIRAERNVGKDGTQSVVARL